MHADTQTPSPPSVRVIEHATAFLRRRWKPILSAAALLALFGWFASGIHVVPRDECAAVLRLGRIAGEERSSGLLLTLPAGIDRVVRVRTGEMRRLELSAKRYTPLLLLTGDENVIEVELAAQYRVTSASGFALGAEYPEALLEQSLLRALLEAVASRSVDDVLTVEKGAIQQQVRQEVQSTVERYGLGIQLLSVNLMEVAPPREAASSFRAVSDSRSEGARLVSEAESARVADIARARGEAEALTMRADADAMARVEAARGQAASLLARLGPLEGSASGLTELQRTALERALGRVRVVVLPPGAKPELAIELEDRNRRRLSSSEGRRRE